jgi:hypothetical protein
VTLPASDFTPSSYDELQAELYKEPPGLAAVVASGAATTAVVKSTVLYRGCEDKDWTLLPSVARLTDPGEAETELLGDFRTYGLRHLDSKVTYSEWDLLSIGQHHGMPTRFLDWSFDPDAALHFVSESAASSATDGVIWMVAPALLHNQLPAPLRRDLANKDIEYPGPFRQTHMDQWLPGLVALDGLKTHAVTPVLFMEPSWTDERIVAQSGVFSLAADPTADLLSLFGSVAGCYRRLIIPPPLKIEIREKLDNRGRDERKFFPGLDGVCRYLRRMYT